MSISCPLRAVEGDCQPYEREQPFTRKALKLLMKSALRLVQCIEQDRILSIFEAEPNEPVLSSNFCDALLRMKPAQDGGVLRLAASWAPVLPPDHDTPTNIIRIRREYFERIEEIYEALRPSEGPKSGTYYGTVESLYGALGDDNRRSGEVTLQVLFEQDLIRVRCDLDAVQYAEADRAHMTGAFVALRGMLHRGRRVHHVRPVESFTLIPPTFTAAAATV